MFAPGAIGFRRRIEFLQKLIPEQFHAHRRHFAKLDRRAAIGIQVFVTRRQRMERMAGFVQNYEELKKKVDMVACTAVNDVFVLTSWAKDSKADGKIQMLADGSAEFAKKLGLEVDLSARGLGVRSRRYSMLVQDGVVKSLNVEEGPGVDKSGAPAMCALA